MKSIVLCFFLAVLGCNFVTAQTAEDLQHQLLEAVEQNAAGEIKSLVGKGADVNMTIPSGSPFYLFFLSRQLYLDGLKKGMQGDKVYVGAIHANAVKANRKVLKVLLKYRANIDAGDSKGKTPLMYALRTPGGEEYALELIRQGANYTSRDLAGNTALHYAAFGGNIEGIRMTMAGGIDINTPNEEGITPIHAAAVRAPVGVLQNLTDMGADLLAVDNMGMNALHYAAAYSKIDKIKWLLNEAPGLLAEAKNGMNPLDIAREAGNNNVVILFRRRGVAFNNYLYSELVESVKTNDLETAEHCLLKGANPNRIMPEYPIHFATKAGHGDMVRLLLRYDADGKVLDQDLNTPLEIAVRDAQQSTVLALLEGGLKSENKELSACLDLLDETGDAAKWLPVLEALARSSDQFDQPGGKMNIPPLHHAAYLGLEEVCRILLEAGAKAGLADKEGWTALHWAVMKGDLKSRHPEKSRIIRMLLENGAPINAKSTAAKSLPHSQPYLARRVPSNATPTDLLDYALPKDLAMEGLMVMKSGERNLQGDDYLNNGVQLYMAKDYRAAMLEFNRSLGKTPESADGLYYRGLCKSELSMYLEAERDLAAALALKPAYPEAVYARGRALFELGDYDNAIQHFDQSIRMEYEASDCIYLRGKCKLRTGRRAGACKDFTTAEAAGSQEAASARKLYCK